MPNWLSLISVSSTVIFILTFTITTILHELAHYVAGWAQGGSPVLHHTFVSHGSMPPRAAALTSASGPLFSLAQGLCFAALLPLFNKSSALTQLFVLWMSLHGCVNFFGYLVTTPFAAQADLGKVVRYLNLTAPMKLGICVVGLAAQVFIGFAATRPFLSLAPTPAPIMTESGRSNLIVTIAVVPWILGSIIAALFRVPSPQWINLVYPFLSGMFSLVTLSRARTVSDITVNRGTWNNTRLVFWIAALIVVLSFFRFVLSRGVRLGKRRSDDVPIQGE